MMLSPLNVGSSIVCGSAKSCAQPTDGQTLTSDSGTLQNFVNIVSRVTRRSFVLKPISLSCCSVICAIDLSGSALSADDQQLLVALVLAGGEARLLEVLGRQVAVALSAAQPVELRRPSRRRRRTPRSPAMPGGMKCWAIGPSASPPRCWRAASRSKPAMTALRTSMSSNGGRLVSIEIMRQPPPGTADSSVLLLSSSRLSWLAGGSISPDDQALASQDAPRRDGRVLVAGLDLDLVEERRAEVVDRRVVRVADDVDALAGHVAGGLALGVGLDHVRAGVDRVALAVGRRVLLVVLLARTPSAPGPRSASPARRRAPRPCPW